MKKRTIVRLAAFLTAIAAICGITVFGAVAATGTANVAAQNTNEHALLPSDSYYLDFNENAPALVLSDCTYAGYQCDGVEHQSDIPPDTYKDD